MVWQEGPIWCRARLDWLPDKPGLYYPDYKTTENANPETWSRIAFSTGAHIQDAFYRRGIKATLGIEDAGLLFVVQEVEPPHAVSHCVFDPAAREYADREVERGMRLWGRCMASSQWPAYPPDIAYMGAPGWLERQGLERDLRDEMTARPSDALLRAAMEAQRPL